MLNVLSQLQNVEADKKNKAEVDAFTKQIKNIKSFAELADSSLTKISGSEENWFLKTFMKFIK